jgi:hypothetical protein
MRGSSFDRAALRAYIARHHLTEKAMAAHAGIAYQTLRGILVRGCEPKPATRGAIENALAKPPPPRPPRKYEMVVRELWGRVPLAEIVRRAGAKRRQDVEQTARRLGLPNYRAAAKRAAE